MEERLAHPLLGRDAFGIGAAGKVVHSRKHIPNRKRHPERFEVLGRAPISKRRDDTHDVGRVGDLVFVKDAEHRGDKGGH